MPDGGYTIDQIFDPTSPFYNGAVILGIPPSAQNSFTDSLNPGSLGAGEIQGNTTVTDGYLQSQNYAVGVAGWRLTPTGGELNFPVSVASLNIPDTTTANSFHVDSSGNTWWGSNVATGYAGATARVLNTGSAVFKDVQVGGASRQYTINDNGIFSFGDGSDGASVISVGTQLSRDMYYTDLTVNAGVTLDPNGYRIFCTGTLTLNGTIARNGNDGGNGAQDLITAGAAGAALADGYLKGSTAGVIGGVGLGVSSTAPGNNGLTGNSVANSLGSNGTSGGNGGTDGARAAGTGGVGGTATASNVKLIANWHLATLLDIASSGSTVKFTSSASGGSGAGGECGGGNGTPVTGGGGSASAGGIIAIYARIITIGVTGAINSVGGHGGHGGNQTQLNLCSGGGGAGGNGGVIILAYNSFTNAGALSVAGGIGGAGGTINGGSAAGLRGSSGSDGLTGAVYQFSLSL